MIVSLNILWEDAGRPGDSNNNNDDDDDGVQTDNDDEEEKLIKGCEDVGVEHGRNGDFNKYASHDCGGDYIGGEDAYYKGFIKGCMSVEGNTRDVCESAADK